MIIVKTFMIQSYQSIVNILSNFYPGAGFIKYQCNKILANQK
jgi:hypothetical protein